MIVLPCGLAYQFKKEMKTMIEGFRRLKWEI